MIHNLPRMAYESHGLPFIARALESLGGEEAVAVKGATIYTSTGNEITDLASGGFGYQHPYILECVKEQVSRLPLSGRVFFSRPLAMLTKKIAAVTPGNLDVSYPCNSTSEAVEGALKLARGYHKKRNKIISVNGSFHGHTMGALSVCGKNNLRRLFSNFSPGVNFVNYGDIDSLKEIIDEKTAALIIEPVMTKSGISIPGAGYISKVQQICRSYGTLLIIDESATGLGHCGKWFASAAEGIVPDIMILGDTLGGGMIPGGAYITSEKINSKVYGKNHPALHGSTTGGNPIMSAAGLAVLETIEKEKLEVLAAEHGRVVQKALYNFFTHFPEYIFAYQSCGLLGSIEVKDKETAFDFQKQAMSQGVAVATSLSGERAWIMINPPLTISLAELKTGFATLENVIRYMESGKKYFKGGLAVKSVIK